MSCDQSCTLFTSIYTLTLHPIYLEPCTTFIPWHHHMTFTSFLIIAYTTSSTWTLFQSIYLFFVLEIDFMRQEGWLTMSKVVDCTRSLTILWLREASWDCYKALRNGIFMHDFRGMECLHFDIVHQSVVLTMWEFKSMMFEVLTKEWVPSFHEPIYLIMLMFVLWFLVKKMEKNKRKHTNLIWFGKLPTSTGTKKKTFTISQLGLQKRVFILTLKHWNSKNTLKPYATPSPPHSLPSFHSTSLWHLPLFLHMSFTQYEPHTTTNHLCV